MIFQVRGIKKVHLTDITTLFNFYLNFFAGKKNSNLKTFWLLEQKQIS